MKGAAFICSIAVASLACTSDRNVQQPPTTQTATPGATESVLATPTSLGTINGPTQIGSGNTQNNYFLASQWREASTIDRQTLVDRLRKLPPQRFRIMSGDDGDARRIARALSDDLKSAHWTAVQMDPNLPPPKDGDVEPMWVQPTPDVHGMALLVKNIHWGADGPPNSGTLMTPERSAAAFGPSISALSQWCQDALVHRVVGIGPAQDDRSTADVVIVFGAPPDVAPRNGP